jgi:hypothetical protein
MMLGLEGDLRVGFTCSGFLSGDHLSTSIVTPPRENSAIRDGSPQSRTIVRADVSSQRIASTCVHNTPQLENM